MSLDPVLFDHPQFETANEAVLFCYEKMREEGLKAEMNRIRGLLPVKEPVIARVVLRELQSLRPSIKDASVARAMDTAIEAVRFALSLPAFLAAS
jgi:hypothetical protein